MLFSLIRNLSILKKFLLINLIIFIFIGTLTIIYLNYVQPNLIKKKSSIQIEVINNTISHLNRLKVNFNVEEIRKFLLSTRFLFQNLDRVVFFDDEYNMLANTDTLDLDPRSFSERIDVVEFEIEEKKISESNDQDMASNKENSSFKKILLEYSLSNNYGKPFTFIDEKYNQFQLSTIKNVIVNRENVGYLIITQNANDIKTAINERKTFIIRTAIVVAIVILIFSFVLNRYFLKPIKNLVNYTENIKEKSKKKIDIKNLTTRNDELGVLSKSVDSMTNDLQKRVNTAENFSTDLVHEIRNPLASLKSASEILEDTSNINEKQKLVKILSHDVERIERLITDYSQMLKDEVAISREQMKKIDLKEITQSVVEDFNAIYFSKRGIKVDFKLSDINKKFMINGIENRIEQVLANLLENSVSFSKDHQIITVELSKTKKNKILLSVIDEGIGFKEKDTNKIFKRFYSNRPDKFGEHSGLGLNIVKNLVELHGGFITAANNLNKKGAKVEISFPSIN